MNEQEIINALESGWITKHDVRKMLGGVSERKARIYLEELNRKLASSGKCILSTAARPGYHIPSSSNKEDMAIVNMAIRELKSKAVSIFERRQILENFESLASRSSVGGVTQLSLF